MSEGKGAKGGKGRGKGNAAPVVKLSWREIEAQKAAAREEARAAREAAEEANVRWVEFPDAGVRVRSDRHDDAWAELENASPSLEVRPATNCVSEEDPVPAGHFRVVCISDTHGLHDKIPHVPDGEVLIHAGDFSNTGELSDLKSLIQWMSRLPHPIKIVIAGNHDVTCEEEYYEEVGRHRFHSVREDDAAVRSLLRATNVFTYLEDEACEVHGYKVFGAPWQPEFCDWAFNLPRGHPCAAAWDRIPTETEILVTHGPCLGHGDLLYPSGLRSGCVDLLQTVTQRVKPLFHIAGHIHEGYGATTNGTTTFIQASTCTHDYKPTNPPILFDLPYKG